MQCIVEIYLAAQPLIDDRRYEFIDNFQ